MKQGKLADVAKSIMFSPYFYQDIIDACAVDWFKYYVKFALKLKNTFKCLRVLAGSTQV